MKEMKALRMEKAGLTAHPVALPIPAADEVLIRVHSCMLDDFPTGNGIPGSNFSGVIEAVGSNGNGLKPGDRVSVDAAMPCGTCYACRKREPYNCEHVTHYGRELSGGMAEYVAIKAAAAYKIPSAMSFDEAVFARPVADAFAAISEITHKLGFSVVVCGDSLEACLVAQMALHSGAGRLCALCADAENGAKLSELGIKVVTLGNDFTAAVDEIQKIIPGSLDVVVDCSGDNALAHKLMDRICPGGRLLLVGRTRPGSAPALDFSDARDFFFHICSVASSAPTAGYFAEGLEYIADGKIQVLPFLAGAFELEHAALAAQTYGRAAGKSAVLIHPNK